MTTIRALHLRWQLVLILASILVLLWSVLSGYFYLRGIRSLEEEARAHFRFEIVRLADQIEKALSKGDREAAARILNLGKREPNVESLILLDGGGNVLAANDSLWQDKKKVFLEPGFDMNAFLAASQRLESGLFLTRDHRGIAAYVPVSGRRAAAEGAGEGGTVLYGRYGLQAAKSKILADVGYSALALLLILTLAMYCLWKVLDKILLTPLKRMTEAVARFGVVGEQIPMVVRGKGELAQLASTFNQISARLGSSQEKLSRQRALYDSLAEINQVIIRASNADEVIQALCRVAVERAGFLIAWVGRPDRTSGRIVPVAHDCSMPESSLYLQDLEILLDENTPSGKGPTATAVREDRVVLINDFQRSDMTALWRERAERFGIRASVAIPIHEKGKVTAVLNVYAAQAGFFTGEIVKLLNEMVADVSFALDHFVQENLRIAAEAALRRSEEYLSLTLDSIGEAVIVTDAEGRIERMNTAAQDLTGWRLKEAGRPSIDQVLMLIDVRSGKPVDNPVSRVLSQGGTVSFDEDIALVSREGKISQVAGNAAPIRGKEGELRGVILVCHDVSDRYALQEALRISEARYRRMFEKGKVVELLMDPDNGVIVDANEKACEFYGYSRVEMQGMPISNINLLPDEEIAEKRRLALREEQSHFHFRHRLKSGEIRDVEVYAGPVQVESRLLLHSIVHDVTRRLRMERFIRLLTEDVADKLGEDFFTAVVRQLGESLGVNLAMVALLKEDGKVAQPVALWINGRKEANLIYELAGTPCEDVLCSKGIFIPEGVRDRYPADRLARELGVESYAGVPLQDSGGKVFGLLVVCHTERMNLEKDEIIPILEIFALRTGAELQRYLADEEIERLAFYDPLTGLPNRRLLLDRLQQELGVVKRNQGWGGLMFLDLDHFKHLNDAWGHPLGDLLLNQVAERLHRLLRTGDTVARIGGDEFVILLADLGGDQETAAGHMRSVAEKIKDEIAAPFDLEGRRYHTSVSIGMTLFCGGEEREELLKQADTAMYRAKASGRNAIRFYHPQMQASADIRLELEKALRAALDCGEFELFYQPQHCTAGKLAGAEALLRWRHGERGFIPPNDFIPIAEESGLILTLGRQVLEMACRQMRQWQDHGWLDCVDHVAVNISPRQFHQTDFVDQVTSIVRASGIAPGKLMLELTEGILIEDMADTISKMKTLREFGVRFSIDDFGTGYSSLIYLKRLPLNELKIDRSFVGDIESDANDRAIVETILAMAEHLGLYVVAEGVETEAQRDFLKAHGCRYFQGYLYSPPVSAADFSGFLRRRSEEAKP